MYLEDAIYFCLGNGSKKECRTCQHERVWDELNELPDTERLQKQSSMKRISDDFCILTKGKPYKSVNRQIKVAADNTPG